MSINDSSDTDNSIEPFPTDGEERDYEAALQEMELQHGSVFKIADHVFEYRGMNYGDAILFRLSDPLMRHSETIPLLDIWDNYQRGNLKLGKWRCRFAPIADSNNDNE